MFVFQGYNDPRVPYMESRQMVKKIESSGKEVWYLEASNEGHGLNNPLNSIYVGASAFTFFEKHLLN